MLLIFKILLLVAVSSCASHDLSCPSSSCVGRCSQTSGVMDVLGPASGRGGGGDDGSDGSSFPHLHCRCDRLCFFYGDCCGDYNKICPRKNHWLSRLPILDRPYLECTKFDLDGYSSPALRVLSKCPQNAEPFTRLLCEAKPSFYNLPSFIPVTGADGRVYRNKYCAKCLHVNEKRLKPWELPHVSCHSALKLVFEDGVNDIPGHQDHDLHSHIISVVKDWMTNHCQPKVKAHPSSNLHFCDHDIVEQKRNGTCWGPYDPVWSRDDDDGAPRLFLNKECAEKLNGNNRTTHCIDELPDDPTEYLLSAYNASPKKAYYPGSLTILLNFGPDGKMDVNMIDKNSLADLKACPKGSVLETATNTCKKLVCPSESKLLADGTCKHVDDFDPDKMRYETHAMLELSVRYNTTLFAKWLNLTLVSEKLLPKAEEVFRLYFNKYFDIDDGGMVNFSISARGSRHDGNGGKETGAAIVGAFFDMKMELILKDERPNDMEVVKKLFDDFNKGLIKFDKDFKAFKLTKFIERISHVPVQNGNHADNVTEGGGKIDWCPNGDLRFYNGSSQFEYWQEETTKKDGSVKNETFVRTYDTDTIYRTGQYDLMVFVETDLMTNEHVIRQIVRVCQRHPWIHDSNCETKVMLNKTEYRMLKNRSVEVLSDHQIYGIDEYEICPVVKKLIPLKEKSLPQLVSAVQEPPVFINKILVCLRPIEQRKLFIAFTAMEGLFTTILLPISMFFLLATASIYIFFKKLRNLPGLILLRLTISLLLSQSLIFFSLNYEVGLSWSCTFLAVANHYLLLVSFCWMNTYAYNIYRTFATFTNLSAMKDYSVTKKFRKYRAYAYGVPLLLVKICVVVELTTGWIGYGGDSLIYVISDEHDGRNATYFGNACWINNPVASVSFFGAPALIMVVVNVVLYALTVRHVKSGSKKMITGRRVSTVSLNADSPVDAKTFMRLSSVMGFAWILGYSGAFVKSIAVTSVGDVLQEVIFFLFVCFTALQGVGIFVAFATGKRVKEELAERWAQTWPRRDSKDSISTISTISTPTSTPDVKDRKFF